ncbi:MAG: xanthine dehydrogenase family protein subunit M [Deltaproteobacteria bacterium]|nr:xanthine dehydrogenase family protein subunit M [Deltaproteobacteria bacterium]
MIPPFEYQSPETLTEACRVLGEWGPRGKIIAGGTDLVISLRKGEARPQILIDVTRIPELRRIEEAGGKIGIGAAVTHGEIASSKLIQRYGKVLSDAASWVGSPQIRNLGTIGGNIVNASPAADTISPLMVLEAVGRVVSKKGVTEVPLAELFRGPYQTNLKPDELLAQISFPKLPSGFRGSFVRLARREAMAIARMSVAVMLRMARGEDRIEEIRISAGAVTPTPHRIAEAESVLRGKPPDEETMKKAAQCLSGNMVRWSGVRPSTVYKAPVVEALFRRCLRQALEEKP